MDARDDQPELPAVRILGQVVARVPQRRMIPARRNADTDEPIGCRCAVESSKSRSDEILLRTEEVSTLGTKQPHLKELSFIEVWETVRRRSFGGSAPAAAQRHEDQQRGHAFPARTIVTLHHERVPESPCVEAMRRTGRCGCDR